MTDETILHVQVGGTVDEATFEHVQNEVQEMIDRLDMPAEVVVSTDEMELHELPALDSYTDELADKIAERLDE